MFNGIIITTYFSIALPAESKLRCFPAENEGEAIRKPFKHFQVLPQMLHPQPIPDDFKRCHKVYIDQSYCHWLEIQFRMAVTKSKSTKFNRQINQTQITDYICEISNSICDRTVNGLRVTHWSDFNWPTQMLLQNLWDRIFLTHFNRAEKKKK